MTDTKTRVFVSHSSHDNELLVPLVDRLKQVDFAVAFDGDLLYGDAIPQFMSEQLGAADKLLMAWSSNANSSVHVWNELEAFYMRKPEPGSILFFRLDEAPIPTLYAARRYVRSTGDPEQDSEAIGAWIKNSLIEVIKEQEASSPTKVSIQQIPKGPKVPFHLIRSTLIDAYAGLLNTPVRAQLVLNTAVELRLSADPADRNVTPLKLQELPIFGIVGAQAFWVSAFEDACLKGPRTLASLLLAQNDDLFESEARKNRAQLLYALRNGTYAKNP